MHFSHFTSIPSKSMQDPEYLNYMFKYDTVHGRYKVRIISVGAFRGCQSGFIRTFFSFFFLFDLRPFLYARLAKSNRARWRTTTST